MLSSSSVSLAAERGAGPELRALTGLRFAAAAAIVAHHARGSFGLAPDFALPLVLDQGVSFFFVLSGFILTWVHSDLRPEQSGRFWWARAARVWPAHAATAALAVLLFGWRGANQGHDVGAAMALTNLTLVQAWLPWQQFFFSFNGVSWTLSAEAFFYLSFPFLVRRLGRWPWILAAVLAPAFGMVGLAQAFGLPPVSADGVGIDALVYIHPLARWPEFVLGMVSCRFTQRLAASTSRSSAWGSTALELGVLALTAWAAWTSLSASHLLARLLGLEPAAAIWLLHGPSVAPVFALLIAVFATSRGAVARLLGSAPLVRLGEISYALYLLHQLLLRGFITLLPQLAVRPEGFALWALLALACSHFLWRIFEVPTRRWLVSRWPLSLAAQPPARTGWLGDVAWNGAVVASILLLIALWERALARA